MAAARPIDFGAAAKELGATALIVGVLTITLVGFHIKDVPGGIDLETRFFDVLSAIVIGVIGRTWLILLRHGRPVPVMWMAWAVGIATFTFLLADAAVDGAAAWVRSLLPFNSAIVQGLIGVVSLGFGIRALVAWVIESRASDEGTRVSLRPGSEAPGAAEEAGAQHTLMDRISAGVQHWSVYIGGVLFFAAVILPIIHIVAREEFGTPLISLQWFDIAVLVMTYVMLGWGLNIVVGLAGLLDLGYVAFYAVGAYAFALLASPGSPLLLSLGLTEGISFWLCLPIAGFVAALAGVALGFPVLRLRGDYLAIVTLGFGEMIRVILLNFYSLTKGPDGISNIPSPDILGYSTVPKMDNETLENMTEFHQWAGWKFHQDDTTILLFYVILVLALITNLFTLRIRRMPVGRAWEALREDEIASRSLGINPTNTKLTAFGLGAMFGGFAGSFFATRQTFVSPESFTFIESAIILAIVVLGGFGSQLGIVVAAIILIGLPEIFRELQQFRMLFFGATMVAIMLWRPAGLLAHREPTIRLHGRRGRRAKRAAAAARVEAA